MYEKVQSSDEGDDYENYNSKMMNLLASNEDDSGLSDEGTFVYKGPQKALEMLSQSQIEILRHSTAVDTNQSVSQILQQTKMPKIKNDVSKSVARIKNQ